MSESAKTLIFNAGDSEQRLALVCKQLQSVRFRDLPRPAGDVRGPISDELIGWSIQMYCFSLLSHFREMLASFLALIKRGYVPAAFVILRTIYEMAAHAYYVHRTVTQYLLGKNARAAWDFLQDINMGSTYMQKPTHKMNEETGIDLKFPVPRPIGKALSAFNEYSQDNRVADNYAFLSEFAHPNMPAFSHYYRMVRSRGGPVFVSPPRDLTTVPFPLLEISTTVVLIFVTKLLGQAGEKPVRLRLSKIVEEYLQERTD